MHSPEILQPDDIGIILSYQCQNSCQHCLYNSSPTRQEWISMPVLEQAVEIIAAEFPGVQIHLTGGEPFLNFNLLRNATGLISAAGINCYVETNAGWSNSPAVARARFLELRDAGLNAVLISCSPYHAETIPLRNTLIALDIAVQIFGSTQVFIYLADWIETIGRFSMSEPVSLDSYVRAYGFDPAGLLLWDGYPLIGGGRAGYMLGKYTELSSVTTFRYETCGYELLNGQHAHMDLFGNYIPGFCGGLTLGDWHNLANIRSNMTNARFSSLIDLLVNNGPYALYTFAHQKYHYEPILSGYADKCHLCVDVRSHLYTHGSDSFTELAPAGFYSELVPLADSAHAAVSRHA